MDSLFGKLKSALKNYSSSKKKLKFAPKNRENITLDL